MSAKAAEAKGKGAKTRTKPASPETQSTLTRAPVVEKATTSYAVFELCVQRARNLVKLHTAAHGKAGKPEKYAADAHRAAIVLAVAALDAFVSEFVLSRTRGLLASKADPVPSSLRDYVKRFLKEDDLFDAARGDDLLERVDKAFRGDFDRRSFQGTKVIEEYLQMVGYKDMFKDVASKAHLNEDTLRDDLDRYTRRRHAIAHRGDYDLSQNPPKENVITKKDAEDCIRFVCLIAKHMDDLGS
jgi:hypothetical protein